MGNQASYYRQWIATVFEQRNAAEVQVASIAANLVTATSAITAAIASPQPSYERTTPTGMQRYDWNGWLEFQNNVVKALVPALDAAERNLAFWIKQSEKIPGFGVQRVR